MQKAQSPTYLRGAEIQFFAEHLFLLFLLGDGFDGLDDDEDEDADVDVVEDDGNDDSEDGLVTDEFPVV